MIQGEMAALPETSELTISDIAQIYKVSPRSLRFYEDKGLLNPRRVGAARFYAQWDRMRLEMILKGKRLGFTLAEISDLLSSRGGNVLPAQDPRISQVFQKATDTFGTEEKALVWFNRPTEALLGLSPLAVSLSSQKGAQKVFGLLNRIDHGLAV